MRLSVNLPNQRSTRLSQEELVGATPSCQFHPLARSTKLKHYLAFVVLGDGAHQLPHQYPGWISRHQVRLGYGDQCKPMFLQIGNRRLLDHQIASKAIQLFDNDRLNAVCVERDHQFRPSGSHARFRCAADTLFSKTWKTLMSCAKA
jgi:hypothetical protein